MSIIRGRVLKYRDHVDTDVIIAATHLAHGGDIDFISQFAMKGIDPDFHIKIREGFHIIVSGKNFGCGSSRQQAPEVIKRAGIKAIVSDSMARIFFRNAINIGLPVFIAPGFSETIDEGDEITIETQTGTIVNQTKKKTIQTNMIPPFLMDILSGGGLIFYLTKKIGKKAQEEKNDQI